MGSPTRLLPLFPHALETQHRGGIIGNNLRIVAAAGFLVILFLGFMLVGIGPSGTPPPPPASYPHIDCNPACNSLTGPGPRPANEVSVAINPTNPMNIVGGANDYGTPNSDAWVGVYTSFDGGKTWNRTLLPGYRPTASSFPQPCDDGSLPGQGLCGFEGAGDPVLAADKDGNFYMAGIAFKRMPAPVGRSSSIFVAKSTDGGKTWPASQTHVLIAAYTSATFHDKEWIAVDPHTSDVYVSWTVFNLLALSEITVFHSSDGGNSWGTPHVVSSGGVFTGTEDQVHLPQVQGSQVEVDNNGTLHLAWIDYNTPNSLKYTRSTDHAATFDTIQTLSPVTAISSPQGNTTYRTPTMADMAVDRTNGTNGGSIYIWWPDESSGDADIMQIFSRDGGTTWSNVTRINNDPQGNGISQYFPAVSVAGNGWVVGEFYDRRDDPDNVNMSVYVAVSTDGGLSYPLQFNWTNQSFDGDAMNPNGTAFIGDYLGVASSDWYTVGLWCDARNVGEGSSTDIYSAILLLGPAPANATRS